MMFRRSTSTRTFWCRISRRCRGRCRRRCPAGSPLSYQSTGPFPDSFQGFIDDPNSVLRDAIADQDILGFIRIDLTTDSQSSTGIPTLGVGSLFETVSNIPFLGVA